MSKVFCILCLLCEALLWADPGVDCTIHLLNGDRVRGTYLGQDRDFAQLQMDSAVGRLRIHGKFIEEIDFGRKASPDEGRYFFQLASDQQIQGDLLEFSDRQMTLKTSWVDALRVESDYVQRVERSSAMDTLLLRGPENPKNWMFGSQGGDPASLALGDFTRQGGGWVLGGEGWMSRRLPLQKGGTKLRLRLNLSDMKANDSCSLMLEDYPGLQIGEQKFKGILYINISQHLLTVEEIPAMVSTRSNLYRGQNIRGSLVRPVSGVVNLSVEFDSGNQRFRVKVGNQVVAEWQLEATEDKGLAYAPKLTLQWRFPSATMIFRELSYDLLTAALPVQSGKIPEDMEAVLFPNDDFLGADWLGVDAEGGWMLLTEDGIRTTLAPGRIQAWVNPDNLHKHLRRVARHVELQLAGGRERFVAELLAADADAITIQREGWQGRIRIPLTQVEHLRFNPYFSRGPLPIPETF